MSIKSIMFCDLCNQAGVRAVDRRISAESSRLYGRRLHDGLSSVVYQPGDPMPEGWRKDTEGESLNDGACHRHIPNFDLGQWLSGLPLYGGLMAVRLTEPVGCEE